VAVVVAVARATGVCTETGTCVAAVGWGMELQAPVKSRNNNRKMLRVRMMVFLIVGTAGRAPSGYS
jgi:hypothetical protein